MGCSVNDLFKEIIRCTMGIESEDKLKCELSDRRADLDNKFRPFLKKLYESVTLTNSEKVDVSTVLKRDKEAYEEFKERLTCLCMDISYNNFSEWINIKNIVDFYRITETSWEQQKLQIYFYKEAKRAMWKLLKKTGELQNIERITKNSLASDKIYEEIEQELDLYHLVNPDKNVLNRLKNIHENKLQKFEDFYLKNKKPKSELEGRRVVLYQLIDLENHILASARSEEEYDEYQMLLDEHCSYIEYGFEGKTERRECLQEDRMKKLIANEKIDISTEQDEYVKEKLELICRCRKIYKCEMEKFWSNMIDTVEKEIEEEKKQEEERQKRAEERKRNKEKKKKKEDSH